MTAYGHGGVSGGRGTGAARDLLLLVGRVLLAAIFIQSGFGKLTGLSGFAAGLEGMGLPMPFVFAVLGAVTEFFGGLALAAGAWTRAAAVLVAVFTVVATMLAHRFWDYPPEQQAMQNIQFMKNLSITGGLLAVAAVGGGRYGVDGMRRGARG